MTDKLPEHINNDDAYRLGEIASLVRLVPAGDYIDTGLALRRLLAERGYWLCRTEPTAPNKDAYLPSIEALREKRKTWVSPDYLAALIAAARIAGWDTDAGKAIRAKCDEHEAKSLKTSDTEQS